MAKRTGAPYRIYIRGETYHAYISFRTLSGQRIQLRETTGTTNQRKAEQYCLKRIGELQQIAERKEKGELEEISFDAALGRFYEETKNIQADAYKLMHRLKNLFSFFRGKMLSEIDEKAVNAFIQYRIKKLKPSSVNRELSDLSALLTRARNRWKVKTSEVRPLSFKLREPAENIEYLKDWSEAQAIIDAAAPHLRPIIYTALYTGFRLSNILRLKWTDIDFKNETITVLIKDPTTPGGRVHTIPMIGPLKEVIQSTPKVSEYVFTYKGKRISSIKTAWRKLFLRSGIRYVNFHALRHTAATWILKKTGNLKITSQILGHTNLNTTSKYAHILDDEKRRALNDVFDN